MMTSKRACLAESDAALAAFLAAGGKITVCPPVGSGDIGRRTAVVVRIRATSDGWIGMLKATNGGGWVMLTDADYGRKRPKVRSRVSFNVEYRDGQRYAIDAEVQ